jgi:hypothetical protein
MHQVERHARASMQVPSPKTSVVTSLGSIFLQYLHLHCHPFLLPRHMASMSSLPSGLLPALVSATMDVYRHVTATLLPVPSRPHYLFSIRHVGAVFKVSSWDAGGRSAARNSFGAGRAYVLLLVLLLGFHVFTLTPSRGNTSHTRDCCSLWVLVQKPLQHPDI